MGSARGSVCGSINKSGRGFVGVRKADDVCVRLCEDAAVNATGSLEALAAGWWM